MESCNYYKWLRGRYAVVKDEDDVKTPISECTAEGGPEKCPYHSRFIRGIMEADSVESNDGLREGLKEVYERIMGSEGVSDEVESILSKVDDAIRSGRIAPIRAPGDLMNEGKVSGFPKWMRMMYHVLAATTPTELPNEENGDLKKEIMRQEKLIRKFSDKYDAWSNDLNGEMREKYGDSFSSGIESEVYDAGDAVVKVHHSLIQCHLPIHAMERFMLHNYYFPESRVNMIGFGRTDEDFGDVGMAFSQRRFTFAPDALTDDERMNYLSDKGFTVIDDGENVNFVSDEPNRLIFLGDMHEDNIRRLADGKTVVHDSLLKLNVPEYGHEGEYDVEWPPEEVPFSDQLKH